MGDETALSAIRRARRTDPSFRNGKEVFDRDLLDMRIATEEIVEKFHNAVGAAASLSLLSDRSRLLPQPHHHPQPDRNAYRR